MALVRTKEQEKHAQRKPQKLPDARPADRKTARAASNFFLLLLPEYGSYCARHSALLVPESREAKILKSFEGTTALAWIVLRNKKMCPEFFSILQTRIADSALVKLSIERGEADPQDASGLALVELGLGQDRHDVLPLRLPAHFPQRVALQR